MYLCLVQTRMLVSKKAGNFNSLPATLSGLRHHISFATLLFCSKTESDKFSGKQTFATTKFVACVNTRNKKSFSRSTSYFFLLLSFNLLLLLLLRLLNLSLSVSFVSAYHNQKLTTCSIAELDCILPLT